MKVVIYALLSAILLYLYYLKKDVGIFIAFVILVLSTIVYGGDSCEEGFGGSGGDACKTLGFTELNIDKEDMGGSLEKELVKIKSVATTHWPYDEKGETDNEKKKESMKIFVGVYFKEVKKVQDDADANKGDGFINVSKGLYDQVNSKDESKRRKININPSDIPKGSLSDIIAGGSFFLKILKSVDKSGELADDAGAKKICKYLICLCKQWISIYKKIDSMGTGTIGSAKK
jgi:hypothetical protein